MYRPVVKFRNLDGGVLKAVQNDVEGEEPGIVSDSGDASGESGCESEMDEPESFPQPRLSSTAERVAFDIDCDINIKSPRLLDLLSDGPTSVESDKTVLSAPYPIDNAEETDLDTIFADW